MGMTDPDVLVDNIITALQSITTLVASPLLSAAGASIVSYKTDMSQGTLNIEDFTLQQPPGTLVVFWRGTRTGVFSKLDSIRHDFGISVKPNGRVGAIFILIREGLCASSGLPFKLTQVNVSVRPPEDISCQNRAVYIGPNFGIREFSDITFTLTERGIDN